MATKRRRKKTTRRSVSPRRRTARRNPRRRTVAKRAARRVGAKMFSGLSAKAALKNVIPTQIGMFGSKWLAKKLGSNNATEGDPESWGYDSYIKGGIGAVGAAVIANLMRPGWGQKALEGGLNLMIYKMIQNEVIVKSDWAVGQFGADDDYVPDEYLMSGDENWFLGQDGNWYPTNEGHRLPEAEMGDQLRPVDYLGDDLVPVTSLGAMRETKDAFRRAYNTANIT